MTSRLAAGAGICAFSSRRPWPCVATACAVPMHFIAAGDDIRPPWPLAQLAALVPRGRYSTVPGVPHTFWFTHPEVWTRTITNACTE
ncbi:alpha/beta fold hydrolase [Dactylosporangium cerinum]|uniref:Alpha/beta fold hydrolase n=1 Tax=Dactylosporangium cerinum TaxID=1434730 RepID=A0ABV9VZI1_9ACTN